MINFLRNIFSFCIVLIHVGLLRQLIQLIVVSKTHINYLHYDFRMNLHILASSEYEKSEVFASIHHNSLIYTRFVQKKR